MGTTVTLSTSTEVELVLNSAAFEPPPSASALSGAIGRLRAEMARFSGTQDHTPRRGAVEAAIASIDAFDFRAEAARRTVALLTGARVRAIADLGFVVPTQTMGCALEVPESDLNLLRQDVLAVVSVIGRQEPTSAAADQSATRLWDHFDQHPAGPVAAISLLYQNHDATAALLAATLFADHNGSARRSALARTVRVAVEPTVVGESSIATGTTVVLDLESSGYEFGAGPHHCPGQRIAEQIVEGMCDAIAASGHVAVAGEIELHADGRLNEIPLAPQN